MSMNDLGLWLSVYFTTIAQILTIYRSMVEDTTGRECTNGEDTTRYYNGETEKLGVGSGPFLRGWT